jgi:3-deoxy-D-manno-octulosonic acid kinase
VGGRRIATADGAMLADMSLLGNPPGAAPALFDPGYWRDGGRLRPADRGRGAVWFIDGAAPWVLKAYRRGGLVARFLEDRYVWAGEARVRAFVEFRLLHRLHEQGLKVPAPVAARYTRVGAMYRCDLITCRIPDAVPLSAALAARVLPLSVWTAVGVAVARLHRLNVDHADLNAHNLLLDGHGEVAIIDFDRGAVRQGGAWRRRNLERLLRSLRKVSAGLPADRFTPAMWAGVLAAYGSS